MVKYDDIIHLSHHESLKHPKMLALDRAAQFLPFALTGYDAAVRKTARLTDNRAELDETRKEKLDLQLLRVSFSLFSCFCMLQVHYTMDDQKIQWQYDAHMKYYTHHIACLYRIILIHFILAHCFCVAKK